METVGKTFRFIEFEIDERDRNASSRIVKLSSNESGAEQSIKSGQARLAAVSPSQELQDPAQSNSSTSIPVKQEPTNETSVVAHRTLSPTIKNEGELIGDQD